MTTLEELYNKRQIEQLKQELLLLANEQNATNVQIAKAAIFSTLLNEENADLRLVTLKAIAEMVKDENNRVSLTDASVVESLLKMIIDPTSEISYNASRALGNICYENEQACGLIKEEGLDKILILIQKYESNSEELNNASCGLLLNVVNYCDDSLQKHAFQCEVQDKYLVKALESNLKCNVINTKAASYLLSVLSIITDNIENESYERNLFTAIVKTMQRCADPEVRALCLELFHCHAENKNLRILLAREGICQLIFDLVEKYGSCVDDEESRGILKMACDLIVMILTEDECMTLLYANGSGTVYKNMLSWLDAKDADLVATGTLAIGNFARNDYHCIQMVQAGTAKKLLKLLAKHNSDEGDLKIQHAVLSTLRNLAIPQKNKQTLIDENIVEVVYPLTKCSHDIVIFKLLGTLRMIIDGQEKAALDLISRPDFLKRLVFWCYNCDHLGIRGEVPRLIVWMMKNSHSFQPFPALLQVDSLVKCLTEMISSNHAVMQNEALYALNLFLVGCKGEDKKKAIDAIVQADVGKHVMFIINKYNDRIDQKTAENLFTFLSRLMEYEAVKEHFKKSGLADTLRKLQESASKSEALSKEFDKILNLIDKV